MSDFSIIPFDVLTNLMGYLTQSQRLKAGLVDSQWEEICNTLWKKDFMRLTDNSDEIKADVAKKHYFQLLKIAQKYPREIIKAIGFAHLNQAVKVDLGSKAGSTGYLDFLNQEHLKGSYIGYGTDAYNRAFLAFSVEIEGKRYVHTIFQRYSCNTTIFVTAGRGPLQFAEYEGGVIVKYNEEDNEGMQNLAMLFSNRAPCRFKTQEEPITNASQKSIKSVAVVDPKEEIAARKIQKFVKPKIQ